MELLRDIEAGGYPTDYLAARIRGRRAALVVAERRDRGPQAVTRPSDEAIWSALLAEFDWLRRQMNPRLRRAFAPLFGLFAIKTVVLCLRDVAAGRRPELERLLSHDLLSEDLRAALRRATDAGVAARAVAEALAAPPGGVPGLADAYAEGGLKALETHLTRGYLAAVLAVRLHPAVGRFFAAFVDLRNVMTLYKHLRWSCHDAAAFIAGGTLDTVRLAEASARGDTAWLDACVQQLAGDAAPALAAGEAALESRLLGGLTRALRRNTRDGDDADRVLDYVWSVYVHARNTALRLHAGPVDAAVLERELIA